MLVSFCRHKKILKYDTTLSASVNVKSFEFSVRFYLTYERNGAKDLVIFWLSCFLQYVSKTVYCNNPN